MTTFEEFYITVAQAAIDFNNLTVSRLESNREQFGMQDKVLANKIDSTMDGLSKITDPFLGESVRQIEERGSIENVDDCTMGMVGYALGTIQSVIPTFVDMNSRLCEIDYGCSYENLVRSGMHVSELINELYMKIMGQMGLIPPLPVPRIVFIDTVIDVYYQTDILFFIDSARMIPEFRFQCGLKGVSATEEEVMTTVINMIELIPSMTAEYGNIANMLSRRHFYPPNHDWAVTILSLLEIDSGFYSEDIFFGIVPGAEAFTKCMIAQSQKTEPFLERLRKIIRG